MTRFEPDMASNPSSYLRAPWLQTRDYLIRQGRFRIRVFDQPGRWMDDEELRELHRTLVAVADRTLDSVPEYGVFTGRRSAFVNRVIGVLSVAETGEPAGFTAMVYLPTRVDGRVEPVMHLGLTMIKRRFRGQRLQGPLFEKLFFLPALNQFRVRWYLTNIAASPAGIGSVAEYFDDCYPHYDGAGGRQDFHLTIAQNLLRDYRHEFGCSTSATFDPETFVVAGSNQPEGGGAHQFIREDPVSQHKSEVCNRFCAERLRFERGDELFQVARLNLVKGVWQIFRRRRTRARAAAAAVAARVPALSGK